MHWRKANHIARQLRLNVRVLPLGFATTRGFIEGRIKRMSDPGGRVARVTVGRKSIEAAELSESTCTGSSLLGEGPGPLPWLARNGYLAWSSKATVRPDLC